MPVAWRAIYPQNLALNKTQDTLRLNVNVTNGEGGLSDRMVIIRISQNVVNPCKQIKNKQ